MASGADLTLNAGDDLPVVRVPLKKPDGTAYDLTGHTDPKLRVRVRDEATSAYELTGTIESPPSAGILTFALPTGGLAAGLYDIQVRLTSSTKFIRTRRYRLEVKPSLPATV